MSTNQQNFYKEEYRKTQGANDRLGKDQSSLRVVPKDYTPGITRNPQGEAEINAQFDYRADQKHMNSPVD